MRNRGPGKWREWRWGSTTLPLVTDSKESVSEGTKPLSMVAHQTINALMAKNSLARLTDAIQELQQTPDDEDGRISEARFREALKEAASTVMSEEELCEVFPSEAAPAGDAPAEVGGK